MERKWVIAAFLDTREFRSWTYRAATSPEIKIKFIKEFYGVLEAYVKKHTDRTSKYEGDGILTIKEFTEEERKNPRLILQYLLSLRYLLKESQTVIRECESPPTGIRIRIMDGYVFKIMVLDPNDPDRKREIPEYVDYCTNTIRGLLGVNPEIACLATEGVVKSLGRIRLPFSVQPFKKPSCYPKSVNREDVDGQKILKW